MRRTLLAAVAALTLAAPAAAQQQDASARLLDEGALRRVADTLDHAVDTKDWALARAQFADRLMLDMSSLGAGPAAEVAAEELVAGWRRAFQGAKTSLHLRTNHLARIEDDAAVMTSHGYAWNRLPAGFLGEQPALWEVWGIYEHRFERRTEGWRVTGFTFTATHERGDRRVPATVLPE